jgi:hypothetical protein
MNLPSCGAEKEGSLKKSLKQQFPQSYYSAGIPSEVEQSYFCLCNCLSGNQPTPKGGIIFCIAEVCNLHDTTIQGERTH